MTISDHICHRSSLYLNQYATALAYPPAAFAIHYWGAKPAHRGNREHSHPFLEICYVAKGSGLYASNGVSYALSEGTLYAAQPGSRHHIHSDEGMVLWFAAFDLQRHACSVDIQHIYDSLCGQQQLFIPGAASTASVHLWQALILQSGEAGADQSEVIARMAHALLYNVLLLFDKVRGALHLDQREAPASSILLQQAERYVQANLARKLSLGEVAHSLYISERQLSRLLSEELGQTFPSWVRTERIRRAAYLLAYTDKPMPVIAEETGFDSAPYFNRVFAQLLNTTPGQFRKMARGTTGGQQAAMQRYLQLLTARHQKRD